LAHAALRTLTLGFWIRSRGHSITKGYAFPFFFNTHSWCFVGELIMNFRRALSAAVSLTSAVVSPACGEDDIEFAAAIGTQGYGRCHMDECGFFVIDAAAPIATGKDAVLFVVEIT
jgi:hypothetical protein